MNTQSENINELFAALSKAQGELKNADKNSINPHFKSKYADLSEFIDASREPLSKYNLSVIQTMGKDDQGILSLFTTLGHSSGQWIRSIFPLICKDDKNIQSWGSSITYIRRYCLGAIIGIAPDEADDDGNKATNQKERNQKSNDLIPKPNESVEDKPKLISKEQIREFNENYDKCDDVFRKHIDDIIVSLCISDLSQLDQKNWKRFMKSFEAYFEKNRKVS